MSMRISEALIVLAVLGGCDQRSRDHDDPRSYPVPLAHAPSASEQRQLVLAGDEKVATATKADLPGRP